MPAETTVTETGSILPVILVIVILISLIAGIVYLIGQWDIGSYLQTTPTNPLSITDFKVDPSTPIAGSEASLSWKVKNAGLFSTGEYKVNLIVDDSSVWSETFNEPLSSGEFQSITRKLTLNRGYHNITIEADLVEEKEGRKPERLETRIAWASQQEANVIKVMNSVLKSAAEKLEKYKESNWYEIYSKLLLAQRTVYEMCIEAKLADLISQEAFETCYRGGDLGSPLITSAIGETVSKSSYDSFVKAHGEAFPGPLNCGPDTVSLRSELNILGTLNKYCYNVIYHERKDVSIPRAQGYTIKGLNLDSVKVGSQVEVYLLGVMKNLWTDRYGIPFVSQFS